jgi:hypothetical protein
MEGNLTNMLFAHGLININSYPTIQWRFVKEYVLDAQDKLTVVDYGYIILYTFKWDRYINAMLRSNSLDKNSVIPEEWLLVNKHLFKSNCEETHIERTLLNAFIAQKLPRDLWCKTAKKLLKHDSHLEPKTLWKFMTSFLFKSSYTYNRNTVNKATLLLIKQLNRIGETLKTSDHDMIVFRGLTIPKTTQWNKGETWKMPEYISTTYSWVVAIGNFCVNRMLELSEVERKNKKMVLLEIFVPRRKRMLLTELSTFQDESEILLLPQKNKLTIHSGPHTFCPSKKMFLDSGVSDTIAQIWNDEIERFGGVERYQMILSFV